MIALTEFANRFQNGLNAALNKNGIQFKIWSDVGKYQKALREGNTVTRYINGNLRVSSSANDANDLVMGINGLTLDFMVPVKPPRTNAKQTAEELAEIQDGQYQFVNEIVNVINAYFQRAETTTMEDENGNSYAVSYQAGTAVGGTVDLLPIVGKAMEVSVYIEVYFIEGGVSSKSVKVYVDEVAIPYTAARFGRSPVTERDVYSGDLISKNTITSTAFAVDIDFPVTASANPFLDYLFSGKPNVAHFVSITQNGSEKLYFMTINSIINSAQGITIAGSSVSLMEVANNSYDIPADFQVRKFIFNSSSPINLTFTLSKDCYIYIAGKAIKARENIPVSISLEENNFEYDETNDEYDVYLITNKQVGVVSASAPYVSVYNVSAVSGVWMWNDNITPALKAMLIPVNFKSNNTDFKLINFNFDRTPPRFYMEYNTSPSNTANTAQKACYVVDGLTSWQNNFRTIDFGEAEQVVSNTFLIYLYQNAKKVG